MLETTTKLSVLFQVLGLWLLVHLKRILLLDKDLAVTEINTKKVCIETIKM